MMWTKDYWVLGVPQLTPAQVRSKYVVKMGVEVVASVVLLQDADQRASLFWKHAGKKEKSFSLYQKQSSQLLSLQRKTSLLRACGPSPSQGSDF